MPHLDQDKTAALSGAAARAFLQQADRCGLTDREIARMIGLSTPTIARMRGGSATDSFNAVLNMIQARRYLEAIPDDKAARFRAAGGRRERRYARVVERFIENE